MSEGSIMSRKRKIEEALVAHMCSDLAPPPVPVLQHIVPAAVGDFVSRVISAVIGKFQREQPDVDAEVERLERLVTMLRAAVEAAEGVHIRNWWLRRWLWTIRDAALEGANVARSFRQRAAEEASRRREKPTPWWGPLVRSGKGLFFQDDDGSRWAATVRREVARLEEMASGMGHFLMLLHLETGLVPPPPQPLAPATTIVTAVTGACCGAMTMPAAVDKQERDADASVDDDQLVERLAVLVIIVHGAVDEAERVQHIRSGFLLEWMSKLRDDALQGDEVLRLFRRRKCRAAESGSSPWKAAKLALVGSLKNKIVIKFVVTGDDGGNFGVRLRLTLASLEKIFSSIGDFLHLVHKQIPVTRPITIQHGSSNDNLLLPRRRGGADIDKNHLGATTGSTPAADAASGFPNNPDIDRLNGLVVDIRRAVVASDMAEVHGKRWLAEWRRELQAVADRADRLLLALSTVPGSAETQANIIVQVRRTAQAHLGDFVTLVRFVVMAN